jgi:hypothetical protein
MALANFANGIILLNKNKNLANHDKLKIDNLVTFLNTYKTKQK